MERHAFGAGGVNGPVVLVGYSAAWLAVLSGYLPDRSVVVVDEPDVIRKRDVRAATADVPVLDELVDWEYQLDGTADSFYAARHELAPAAVVPVVEYGVPFAARLAERYGVPGAGYGAACVLRDKRLQRAVTAAAGIPNPRSVEVSGPDEAHAFLADAGGPIVLKPADRQAAVGTVVVRDPAGLDAAWAECLHRDEGIFFPDRRVPSRILAEQFVSGDEYSVELMVDRGRRVFGAVTRKYVFAGPRPVEQGHVQPIEDGALAGRLLAGTERVVDATGMATGFVHCEWIVEDGVPHFVEAAGRMPGGWIPNLIELAWDYDVFGHYIGLMVGQRLRPAPATAAGAAAIWMSATETTGEVDSVGGIADAEAMPGVHQVIAVEPGERVHQLRSSWDRTAGVIATGPTARAAVATAQEALRLVRIKVRPTV